MKILIATATVAALFMGSALNAETVQTFHNPCERGPWPRVSIINDARYEFIMFLKSIRPSMPDTVSLQIAERLCADMSLVGDSEGLTAYLNSLLKEYGY